MLHELSTRSCLPHGIDCTPDGSTGVYSCNKAEQLQVCNTHREALERGTVPEPAIWASSWSSTQHIHIAPRHPSTARPRGPLGPSSASVPHRNVAHRPELAEGPACCPKRFLNTTALQSAGTLLVATAQMTHVTRYLCTGLHTLS